MDESPAQRPLTTHLICQPYSLTTRRRPHIPAFILSVCIFPCILRHWAQLHFQFQILWAPNLSSTLVSSICLTTPPHEFEGLFLNRSGHTAAVDARYNGWLLHGISGEYVEPFLGNSYQVSWEFRPMSCSGHYVF
jgi:hypothetical protein